MRWWRTGGPVTMETDIDAWQLNLTHINLNKEVVCNIFWSPVFNFVDLDQKQDALLLCTIFLYNKALWNPWFWFVRRDILSSIATLNNILPIRESFMSLVSHWLQTRSLVCHANTAAAILCLCYISWLFWKWPLMSRHRNLMFKFNIVNNVQMHLW